TGPIRMLGSHRPLPGGFDIGRNLYRDVVPVPIVPRRSLLQGCSPGLADMSLFRRLKSKGRRKAVWAWAHDAGTAGIVPMKEGRHAGGDWPPLPPVNGGVQGHRRPVVAGIQDFVRFVEMSGGKHAR